MRTSWRTRATGVAASSRSVKQRLWEPGGWSEYGDASHHLVAVDPATGDAEIEEYDRNHDLLRRFVWEMRADATGLLVEFGPDGDEVGRERYAT